MKNPTRLVARSVSMIVVERKSIEEETKIFFLKCYMWEYHPKPARIREKDNETGKESKPYKVKDTCWPLLYNEQDAGGLLTNLIRNCASREGGRAGTVFAYLPPDSCFLLVKV